MPESNRLCREFLFAIVPEGRGRDRGSVGKSHDRIGLAVNAL